MTSPMNSIHSTVLGNGSAIACGHILIVIGRCYYLQNVRVGFGFSGKRLVNVWWVTLSVYFETDNLRRVAGNDLTG